jgi:FkbM family methyltransferase
VNANSSISTAVNQLARVATSPFRIAGRGLWTIRRWHALFSDLESLHHYRHLRRSSQRDILGCERQLAIIRLRLKPLNGNAVYCRPGTTDVDVLDDTFIGMYHLPPADMSSIRTILDLGSNIGLTIAHYATMYPDAKIFGVELDRDNFQVCTRNIEPYCERCSVQWGAAWCHNGRVRYEGDAEWGYRVQPSSVNDIGRSVPAFTVNTLIEAIGAPIVDFVKMDVEGAEEVLLSTSAAWLRRVRCIKVEIHAPYSTESCVAALRRLGFDCELDQRHWACVLGRRRM